MSHSFISLFVMLGSLFIPGTTASDFELPKTWTKDFTISISHTGSMDGSSTHLTFTYDSCKYVRNSGMEASKESFFRLTESDRIEILKKMHALKVDKIHSEASIAPVNDGWSTSLCFSLHCIEGGTSARMSDHDKDQFLIAYGYLEDFALKRSRK